MPAPLITDEIPTDPGARAEGLAPYPTSSAWDAQDWAGLSRYLFDSESRAIAATGTDPVTGAALFTPNDEISAEDANTRFGIPGALKFDGAINPDVAQSLSDEKREALFRQDADERTRGFGANVARMGAGFVAGALDPVNVAASFVPVVSEARMAGWLADAGSSALAKAGVVAGSGALRGAAGQALLEPLVAARAQSEQDDYGATNVLTDLAFGAALGGGLHLATGAGDILGHSFAASVPGQAAAASPELRAAALRAAVAQVTEGRPVEVRPVFNPQDPAMDPTFDAALRAARDPVPAPAPVAAPDAMTPEALEAQIDDVAPAAAQTQALARVPPRPADIVQFLARGGGVRDEGGELAAMDADKITVPFAGRLMRDNGRPLDAAREQAEEAGYLPRGSDINDLLDAISETQSGIPRFSTADENAALAWREAQGQQREAEATPLDRLNARARAMGIEPGADWTPEETLAAVHERLALEDEGAPHAGRTADAIEGEIDRAGGDELPWFEEKPDAGREAGEQPEADEGARGPGAAAEPGAGAVAQIRGAGAGPEGGGAPSGEPDETVSPADHALAELALTDPETRAAVAAGGTADELGRAYRAAAACLALHA